MIRLITVIANSSDTKSSTNSNFYRITVIVSVTAALNFKLFISQYHCLTVMYKNIFN